MPHPFVPSITKPAAPLASVGPFVDMASHFLEIGAEN